MWKNIGFKSGMKKSGMMDNDRGEKETNSRPILQFAHNFDRFKCILVILGHGVKSVYTILLTISRATVHAECLFPQIAYHGTLPSGFRIRCKSVTHVTLLHCVSKKFPPLNSP